MRKVHKVLVLAGLAFAEVLYLHLTRYYSLTWPMHDLSVMTQAIWSAAHGRLLEHTMLGHQTSRLLNHAEVIYFALAPLMRAFPSAATLLVVEAALYASAAWPVYRLGERYGGQGLWAAAVYLFYPVAQTAVLAEFHSDPLAMAFLLWGLDAMEAERWGAFQAWMLLVLLSKSYMLVPVVLIAGILWARGKRKWALVLVLEAAAWGWLAFLGFKLWLSAHYHASPDALLSEYVGFRYGHLLAVLARDWAVHLGMVLIVIAPVLPWMLKAPLWSLAALALVVPAAASTRMTFVYYYHHYAAAVPFLLMAGVQGRAHARGAARRRGDAWTAATLAVGIAGGVFWVVFVLGMPSQPWRGGAPLVRGRAVIRWVRPQVTPTEPVLASANLLPFFATRPWADQTFYVPPPMPSAKILPPQVVMLDAFQEGNQSIDFFMRVEQLMAQQLWRDPRGWEIMDVYDGVFVLRRTPTHQPLAAFIRLPAAGASACPPEAMSGGNLAPGMRLVCFWAVPAAPRTLETHFVWQREGETPPPEGAFAVSHVGGWVPHGERMLHFPAWAIYPPEQWPQGRLVEEVMSWPVALTPGCYPLDVGWYRLVPNVYPADAPQAAWGKRLPLGGVSVAADGAVRWVPACP